MNFLFYVRPSEKYSKWLFRKELTQIIDGRIGDAVRRVQFIEGDYNKIKKPENVK